MQRRRDAKKRRRRDDDEEEQRRRKRGKEEADEDDYIEEERDEYDIEYSSRKPWSEEEDLRVSWLRFERRILVLDFEAHALAWLWAGFCVVWVADSAADVRASEWVEAELDARGGEVSQSE